jgi:phosphoribosylformylglycinamidine synthase
MQTKPNALLLVTDGVNCNAETDYAAKVAGLNADQVHINCLRSGKVKLADYQLLVVCGGFSYGDHGSAGLVLANELVTFFKDDLATFIKEGKLIVGICNGFQVLAQAGLLPKIRLGKPQITLNWNTNGRFHCQWVEMVTQESPCVFTKSLSPGTAIMMPGAHGEGRFTASESILQEIEKQKLVVLRYSKAGKPTMDSPANPNGSVNAIAGICDKTGRIFGLMPHWERAIEETQHPNWRRGPVKMFGLVAFENAFDYIKRNL